MNGGEESVVVVVVVVEDALRLCLCDNLLFTSFTNVFTALICIANKLGDAGVQLWVVLMPQAWMVLEGLLVVGWVLGCGRRRASWQRDGSHFNTCQ